MEILKIISKSFLSRDATYSKLDHFFVSPFTRCGDYIIDGIVATANRNSVCFRFSKTRIWNSKNESHMKNIDREVFQ